MEKIINRLIINFHIEHILGIYTSQIQLMRKCIVKSILFWISNVAAKYRYTNNPNYAPPPNGQSMLELSKAKKSSQGWYRKNHYSHGATSRYRELRKLVNGTKGSTAQNWIQRSNRTPIKRWRHRIKERIQNSCFRRGKITDQHIELQSPCSVGMCIFS